MSPASISNQYCSATGMHNFLLLWLLSGFLEKFATEIRGLQKTDTREVEEPFSEGQTGSSAMPHKRNPELCERICGLSRLIRGYSVTAMENIALCGTKGISATPQQKE